MALLIGLDLTVSEVLLQVVQDLRWVADDVVIVDQDRHLTGWIQTHEPRLVVLAERQADVILLAAQTFLCCGQTHLKTATATDDKKLDTSAQCLKSN